MFSRRPCRTKRIRRFAATAQRLSRSWNCWLEFMVGEPTHIYTRIKTSFFLLLSIKCCRFSSAATGKKCVENFLLFHFGQQQDSHWPGIRCALAWKVLSSSLQRHLSSERVTFVCFSMNNSGTRKPFKHIFFCAFWFSDVPCPNSHDKHHPADGIRRHCRMQIANTNQVTPVTHHWIFSRIVAAEKAFGMLTNSPNYSRSICYFRVANCVHNMCDVHATKRARGFPLDTHTHAHIPRHSSPPSSYFIYFLFKSSPNRFVVLIVNHLCTQLTQWDTSIEHGTVDQTNGTNGWVMRYKNFMRELCTVAADELFQDINKRDSITSRFIRENANRSQHQQRQ